MDKNPTISIIDLSPFTTSVNLDHKAPGPIPFSIPLVKGRPLQSTALRIMLTCVTSHNEAFLHERVVVLSKCEVATGATGAHF
jgi:hypothetical protein